MKVLYWLRDHWYLPLFLIGVVLGVLFRRGSSAEATKLLKVELKAIRAGSEARKMKAIAGSQRAADEIRQQHADELAALNDEQARQAEALHDDPVALSRFLVRAARGS